jgi:hypothetical protein
MLIAMVGSPDTVAVIFLLLLLLLAVIRMILLLFDMRGNGLFDLCGDGTVSVLLDLRIIKF